MARNLSCPSCAEDDDLSGRSTPDGIVVTCGSCGTEWPRDAAGAVCATCGGADLEQRPQATTAYSRGTQVSIVGWRQVPLCVRCDADMLSQSLAGKPVPNGYTPAAQQPPTTDGPEATGGAGHSILPR